MSPGPSWRPSLRQRQGSNPTSLRTRGCRPTTISVQHSVDCAAGNRKDRQAGTESTGRVVQTVVPAHADATPAGSRPSIRADWPRSVRRAPVPLQNGFAKERTPCGDIALFGVYRQFRIGHCSRPDDQAVCAIRNCHAVRSSRIHALNASQRVFRRQPLCVRARGVRSEASF